jgi:hypothetical protein
MLRQADFNLELVQPNALFLARSDLKLLQSIQPMGLVLDPVERNRTRPKAAVHRCQCVTLYQQQQMIKRLEPIFPLSLERKKIKTYSTISLVGARIHMRSR